jgi:hypothetical protein
VLYAPAESVLVCRPLGEQLRALAPALLSRTAVHRFVGYMSAQREIDARLAEGRTPLPAGPDWAAISAWSVAAHRSHWGWA